MGWYVFESKPKGVNKFDIIFQLLKGFCKLSGKRPFLYIKTCKAFLFFKA